MLSEKDRKEYKKSVHEMYSEVGTTKIEYYSQTASNEEDLYGELDANFSDTPLMLVGVIEPIEPTPDALNPIPNMGLNYFTFDIPTLSLENHNLDPYTMLKGLFRFDNRMYNILDVTPEGMFTDFYTTFKFKVQML